MSTDADKAIADAIEKTMADDAEKREAPEEMEERENPFIKHFEDGVVRDIAGREVEIEFDPVPKWIGQVIGRLTGLVNAPIDEKVLLLHVNHRSAYSVTSDRVHQA